MLTLVIRFWTRFQEGNEDVKAFSLDFAMDKLLHHSPLDMICDWPSENGLLAALSVRLDLEFDRTRHVARELETVLVQQHLRIAYSIPKHRQYIISGYPSEPLLAEAAAQAIRRYAGRIWEVPKLLASFAEKGIIKDGRRGRLVMRMMLMIAYDRAVLRNTAPKQFRKFSDGVPVLAFLEELFQDYTGIVSQSLPDMGPQAMPQRPLCDAFRNAYVRFTHFGVFDLDTVNSNRACPAFIRGIAMSLDTDNESVFDCAIPVILQDDFIREEIMSVILVRCFVQPFLQESSGEPSELQNVQFFRTQRNGDERPYIVLNMRLHEEVGVVDCRQALHPLSAYTITECHPRYCIDVTGLSALRHFSEEKMRITVERLLSNLSRCTTTV